VIDDAGEVADDSFPDLEKRNDNDSARRIGLVKPTMTTLARFKRKRLCSRVAISWMSANIRERGGGVTAARKEPESIYMEKGTVRQEKNRTFLRRLKEESIKGLRGRFDALHRCSIRQGGQGERA
jgi:hypothetical protein